MKITTITPEQESRFEEWRDRWTKIGLSTEPADFGKAEKAALRAYDLCGFKRPKIIIRAGSPYAATLEGPAAYFKLLESSSYSGNSSRVKHRSLGGILQKVNRKVEDRLERQVDQQVWQQVDQQVRCQVSRHVLERVQEQVWWWVGDQVHQQLGEHVYQQIERRVWEQVPRKVYQQAKHKVWLNFEVCLEVLQQFWKKYAHKDFGGSFWSAWCGYITYFRDVLGWHGKSLEKLSIEEDLAMSCGWIWWSKDVLAISDRPSKIYRDEQGRLHNENGPSIAYRDGWKLYHIHGVAVPDFVVERPDKITVEHIKNEENVEVRRFMIERMGLERFIRESRLRPVHSDDFGTLYREELEDDEPLVVVKVVNSTPESDGSRKEYFLRVPPDVKRAREAAAWTFGMAEKEYRPLTET